MHPAEQYARDVLAGKIIAGKHVRSACQRYVRDLEEGHKRGLRFDRSAAEHAIAFFKFLRHSKGEWAGEEFALAPWQQFIVWNLFGWKLANGFRRFRVAYNELARKNGKSTLAAGIGLYLLVADGEPGAEIYTAATKRDQARIVHGEAVRMVKASTALKRHIRCFKDNLHIEDTASKFEPLGADEDSMDGLNIHGVIIDELHAHKQRKMLDVLETATGARRQPLEFIITTAGFGRESVCRTEHDYSLQVLDGIIDDDSRFVFIAAIDEGDCWDDPTVWIKANPNLGISVKLDDLERKCKKAKETPSAQNAFRRLHCNEWTEQDTRWLDMQDWDACSGGITVKQLEKELEGETCFGGLDLATTTDIASLCLVFPARNGSKWRAIWRCWVPRDNIEKRVRRDRVPYDVWARQGFIAATSGNVIDQEYIHREINTLRERYHIAELRVDLWNATPLVTQLQRDGVNVKFIGQGFRDMNAPTKELEGIVMSRNFEHGGNPVARWAASNVVVEQDAAGNLKPSKAKATERIDPIVALIDALSAAIASDESTDEPAVVALA